MYQRLAIDFPATFHFSTPVVVRVGDINYANHLAHDRLITMLHEARKRFFEVLGIEEYQPDGVGIVIADLAIQYLKEAFYGDYLRVDVSVPNLESKSMQLVYKVTREDSVESPGKTEVVATAKTGAVFFDFSTRKAVNAPDFLSHSLAELESDTPA